MTQSLDVLLQEQKWLIGIILMVPIYAVTSVTCSFLSNYMVWASKVNDLRIATLVWRGRFYVKWECITGLVIGFIWFGPLFCRSQFLSLLLPKLAIYFTIMGNCYEAFALYAFGCYLIACLGMEHLQNLVFCSGSSKQHEFHGTKSTIVQAQRIPVWHKRVIFQLNGPFRWGELVITYVPLVGFHTTSTISFRLWCMLGGSFEFEWRPTYSCSLRSKLIYHSACKNEFEPQWTDLECF